MGKARGRVAGFVMSDEHRVKIQNSNVLNALIEHAIGKRDMSATQVSAGIALLRKVLPDLSSVDHTGSVTLKHEDALEQLASIKPVLSGTVEDAEVLKEHRKPNGHLN